MFRYKTLIGPTLRARTLGGGKDSFQKPIDWAFRLTIALSCRQSIALCNTVLQYGFRGIRVFTFLCINDHLRNEVLHPIT
jgi:hypothetical protein